MNLHVEEGESLVVRGGSGTGKTVLLRNIMGLLTPDSGHVAIEGKIIAQLSRDELFQVRQNIGKCYQLLTLNLSSEEELEFRTSADKLKSTLKNMRLH